MSKLLWEMKCFKHSVWSIDFSILMVENVFHFFRFKKSWMKTKRWALILRKMTVSFCQITSCEKKIDFSSQKIKVYTARRLYFLECSLLTRQIWSLYACKDQWIPLFVSQQHTSCSLLTDTFCWCVFRTDSWSNRSHSGSR